MGSVLTVTQLNKYLSFKIKADPKLMGVAVRGEVSNFNINYRSGHAYFSLKDDTSAISCVMFASAASKLRFDPEDGMSVMAIGNVGVYERSGNCQMIVTEMLPAGAGAVHVSIEQTKKELEELGVFAAERKKKIPLVPKKLAVVTSLTGAALQDIIHITERRYPLCELLVFPAAVQGESAQTSICEAIKKADRSGADTLILARGGGSAEDLMPFNRREVVLAVADCETPVITAVGHETDTTLVDYAADLRAPTPSAAAELAVPDRSEMTGAVEAIENKLAAALGALISDKEQRLTQLSASLKLCSPEKRLDDARLRLDGLDRRLKASMAKLMDDMDTKISERATVLEALSPFRVLSRGYSIVMHEGRAVTSSAVLKEGDRVSIRFAGSSAEADIVGIKKD